MKDEDKKLIEKYLKQGYDKKYLKEKFRLMNKDLKIIDDYFHYKRIKQIKVLFLFSIVIISISYISVKFYENYDYIIPPRVEWRNDYQIFNSSDFNDLSFLEGDVYSVRQRFT